MTLSSLITLRPGMYRLEDTTPPAEEPVTLAALKTHVRVDGTAEDTLLAAQIKTAREMVEAYSGLAMVARGRRLFLDAWPQLSGAVIVALPVRPVIAVTGIKVYAADDSFSTVDTALYTLDVAGGRLHLRGGLPLPGREMNGIEIGLTVGHGTADAVPEVMRHAVRLLAAHFYTHRGDAPAMALRLSGAADLLAPLRQRGLL